MKDMEAAGNSGQYTEGRIDVGLAPGIWREAISASSTSEQPKTQAEPLARKWWAFEAVPIPASVTGLGLGAIYLYSPTYEAGYLGNGHLSALEAHVRSYVDRERELISQVLGDEGALFIAWQMSKLANKSLRISDLEELLSGAAGWVPFSKLTAAGVVELAGDHACLSEKGERLIQALGAFLT